MKVQNTVAPARDGVLPPLWCLIINLIGAKFKDLTLHMAVRHIRDWLFLTTDDGILSWEMSVRKGGYREIRKGDENL